MSSKGSTTELHPQQRATLTVKISIQKDRSSVVDSCPTRAKPWVSSLALTAKQSTPRTFRLSFRGRTGQQSEWTCRELCTSIHTKTKQTAPDQRLSASVSHQLGTRDLDHEFVWSPCSAGLLENHSCLLFPEMFFFFSSVLPVIYFPQSSRT